MKTKTKRNEAAAGWKRCADEMPSTSSTVIIHHPDEVETVWLGYHDGEKWRYADGVLVAVTHWMPLPTPPSGVDKRLIACVSHTVGGPTLVM